jgi:nickel-dependent lactate racemase
MRYTIPYGHAELAFESDWPVDQAALTLPDLPAPTLHVPALDLKGKTHAVIVFTDATRHSPDQWLAEHLLSALPLAPEQITFLCALGMHRPSTPAEKVAKLGAEIVSRYHVLDHDPAQVITIGQVEGIPIEINPLLADPQTYLILMGVVEPHQYAGYSGGAKTAIIGCGGPQTIALTHGPHLLDQAGVRLGQIEGNPFQAFVRQAGQLLGVDLIANVVMPQHERITHAAVGGLEVHDLLVAQARQLYETRVPNAPYDIVLAGVSSPKDANLYQASRAATYIGLSGAPVLRPGGVIIVPAELPEGVGVGQGEQNFHASLQGFGPTPALMSHLRGHGCLPGQQRAYMIAQLLERYHCIFVGTQYPQMVREAGFQHSEGLAEALVLAHRLLDQPAHAPRMLLVADALKTLPIALE